MSYPSPATYPSHGYPQHEQDGSEPYRGHQDGNTLSLPPLNLPPIRSIEDFPSPYQGQNLGEGIKLEPLLTPAVQGVNGYYQSAPQLSPYPQPPMQLAAPSQYIGYPQPGHVQDQRMLSGTRHKKEIKRRTKTGCLTCRKRRIKCDEAHPVCRNCQKSKRECAGYDPIFKQSQPPLIYPPTLNHNGLPLPQPSQTSTASSTPAVAYSPVPQGYAPVPNPDPYHQTLVSALRPPLPIIDPPYDYGNAAIDPALGSNEHPVMASHTEYDPVQHLQPNLDSSYNRDATYTSPAPLPVLGSTNGKRVIGIEELYMIGGVDPPTPKPSTPLTPEMQKETRYMSTIEYAKGIDRLLETTWYNDHGVALMLADTNMRDMFAGMLELFRVTKGNDYDALRKLPSTESKVIWSVMSLPCRELLSLKSENTSGTTAVPNKEELIEATHRVAILEKLLTGQVMEINPLGAQPIPTPLGHTGRQKKFWHLLGQFVSIPPTQGLQVAESVLSQLRQVLDELEGRDVLYSIAIVRHIGSQIEDFPSSIDGAYAGPGNATEEKTKLRVAKKFIEDEAAGKGTTQVIQRLCAMAVRSWGIQWT